MKRPFPSHFTYRKILLNRVLGILLYSFIEENLNWFQKVILWNVHLVPAGRDHDPFHRNKNRTARKTFLVHLSRRLKCTIVIIRCPSLTFTFSTSPLKPLNRIQRNLSGSKISTSSTKFVFFGPIGKTKCPPPPMKPLNQIGRNLTGSKISRSSTRFVFFGPIRTTRWRPWPLIFRDIFDFSSETTEQNLMKLDRKQDLNVLYQVCVFQAKRKIKMAVLASNWWGHCAYIEAQQTKSIHWLHNI